jgi:DNA-binding CsgD family transcriptional regulator
MEQDLHLTPAERAVLKGILRGEGIDETCAKLHIRHSQYKSRVARLMEKTHTRNQVELVNKVVNPI